MLRLIALVSVTLFAGCDGGHLPPLAATDVEITGPLPGRFVSAGFLTLTNSTDTALHISRVSSAQFDAIEIHETQLVDGVSKMRKLSGLTVPAHGWIRLERGGTHLMLLRPKDKSSPVSLDFFDGDHLLLSIDVVQSTP